MKKGEQMKEKQPKYPKLVSVLFRHDIDSVFTLNHVVNNYNGCFLLMRESHVTGLIHRWGVRRVRSSNSIHSNSTCGNSTHSNSTCGNSTYGNNT